MEFKLVYGNHGKDPFHIIDTLLLIKFSLESLGYKADLDERMSPGKVNILLECFSYDFLEAYKELHQSPGTEFIIVATEFLTGETFNDFGQPGCDERPQSHYEWTSYWKKRQKTFLIAQQLARSVWHLADSQVPVYQQVVGQTPVHYLPHGHTDAFARVVQKRWDHKDIDVVFTGTLTSHRLALVEALKARGINAVATRALNTVLREELVARAKLGINLKQCEDWQYASNSRYHYHLSNRSLLVSEHCPISCDLSHYVTEAPPNDFVDCCAAMLARADLQTLADDRLDAFRQEMPMQRLMAELLANTFA